eukprot:4737667-Lingulodinium_polyedra.AAC.1
MRSSGLMTRGSAPPGAASRCRRQAARGAVEEVEGSRAAAGAGGLHLLAEVLAQRRVEHPGREHAHGGDVVKRLREDRAAELQQVLRGVDVVLAHAVERLREAHLGRRVEDVHGAARQVLEVRERQAPVPPREVGRGGLHALRQRGRDHAGLPQGLQRARAASWFLARAMPGTSPCVACSDAAEKKRPR